MMWISMNVIKCEAPIFLLEDNSLLEILNGTLLIGNVIQYKFSQ